MNLKEKLTQHKDVSCLSQEAIAKELNVSGAALSNWLKGKYKGDNAKMDELVEQYLERSERRTLENKVVKLDFDFVETSVYTLINNSVNVSDAYKQIRVIVGDSGVGKTTALQRIRDTRSNAVYVAVYKGIRKNRFLDKLCTAAGIKGYGSFDDKFELLVSNLSGSGRVILVDEVEHLPIDAIDALRRINDFTSCSIILAGLPIFLDRLAKYPEYAYIFKRLALPIVLPHLNENDVEKLVKTMIYDECAITNEEWHKYALGLGRDLKIIVQESLRVATLNNIPISNVDRFRNVIKKVTTSMACQIFRH